MDYSNLNEKQVEFIIRTIKKLLNEMPKSFPLPSVSKVNETYKVRDENYNIDFKLHVYRGRIENRYSMHIRFSKNNMHLVRLCINSGTGHKNYADNTSVGKSHIHIYDVKSPTNEYAYGLDDYDFFEEDELIESFEKFLKFLSIEVREDNP